MSDTHIQIRMRNMDSRAEEVKLLRALDKAADLSRVMESPDDVIVKVATEMRLSPPEVCRVVEMYNKAKSVAILKTASSDSRADDFPIANMNNVMDKIYGQRKVAEEAGTITRRDYSAIYFATPMDKAAAEIKVTERVNTMPVKLAEEQQHAVAMVGSINRVRHAFRSEMAKLARELDVTANKIAALVETGRPKDVVKYSRNMVNGLGKLAYERLLDVVSARLSYSFKIPTMDKTAHAVVMPCDELHTKSCELAKLVERYDAFKKVASAFEKRADEELGELARMMQHVDMGLRQRGTKVPEAYSDPETLMPTDRSNQMKPIGARRALFDIYESDPIVRSYPIDQVQDAFNSVQETAPGLARNPMWMVSSMRRMLQQGGAIDPFEVKGMLEASSTRSGELKNRAEYANILSGSQAKDKVS